MPVRMCEKGFDVHVVFAVGRSADPTIDPLAQAGVRKVRSPDAPRTVEFRGLLARSWIRG
jgi:hypothetical protein